MSTKYHYRPLVDGFNQNFNLQEEQKKSFRRNCDSKNTEMMVDQNWDLLGSVTLMSRILMCSSHFLAK